MRVCPQCAAYRAQILLLKIQIERLHRIINKLVQLIKRIEHYVFDVYKESAPIVKAKSGYAPVFYIAHKSRWIIAKRVLKIIRDG